LEAMATRPLSKYDWPRERTESLKSRETFWAIPIIPSYSDGHDTGARGGCPPSDAHLTVRRAGAADGTGSSFRNGAPDATRRLRDSRKTDSRMARDGQLHWPTIAIVRSVRPARGGAGPDQTGAANGEPRPGPTTDGALTRRGF